MPNKWRTINSWVHKVRLHGRRGKRTAESFSREKIRQVPQEEGGEIICDLPPGGLSSDLYPPRSIEGKSRTKLCQKPPQVPGLGHPQSYARFKGGKTKQGYQRMVGWCRLMVMVMADGDG